MPPNLDEIQKLSLLTIYRLLIKNMRYYPSKNRFQILLAMKEDFRDHRNITDKKLKMIEIKKAKMGLAHVLLYKEKNQELKTQYSLKSDGFNPGLNPRDKDFIYF